MIDMVLQTAERFGMLQKGDAVVVALSGGADSVSLLHCLYSIKESYNLTLHAAHLHHGIRGAEADRDAQFCKILCEKYNIPFHLRHADIPKLASEQKISEELCGRQERQKLYHDLSASLHAKVATAHTASDSAETLLFHLARGTSFRGAAGIAPVRGFLIRPLIDCTREQVERYCAENALDYVTDSTNLTDDYTRNRIRHHLIPLFRELNPRFEDAARRFCDNQYLIKDYMDSRAQALIRQATENGALRADVLLAAHPAERAAALLRYCQSAQTGKEPLSLETRHLDLLCGILRHGGAVPLGRGCTAICKQGLLRVRQSQKPCRMFPVPLNGSVSFLYHRQRVDAAVYDSKNESNSLVFRNRQPGDRFTYVKRGVTKPLRKALNEKKIPDEKRGSLLLLCQGAVVLWCEGLGFSAQGEALRRSAGLSIEISRWQSKQSNFQKGLEHA